MADEKPSHGAAFRKLPDSLAKIATTLGEPDGEPTLAAGGVVRPPTDRADDSVPFRIPRCLYEEAGLATVITPGGGGNLGPVETAPTVSPVDRLTDLYAQTLNAGMPRPPGAFVVPDDLRPQFDKLLKHAPDAAINAPLGGGLLGTPVIYLQPRRPWWRRLADRAVRLFHGRAGTVLLVITLPLLLVAVLAAALAVGAFELTLAIRAAVKAARR
ncbi:hypothetical protein GCM10027258_62830 [Amycolatopsis stemonae]